MPETQESTSAGLPVAYLGHLDPVLHHHGPVPGCHARVAKAGGDDTLGHTIELGDSGPDCGCQVLTARLVALGPDGAQALMGQQLLEQLLENRGTLVHPAISHARLMSYVGVTGQSWTSGS